jgi:hypothetical protein
MKDIRSDYVSAWILAICLFIVGCADPCKDVTCDKGNCIDGHCVCTAGYEGEACNVAIAAKFSGTYTLTETCLGSGAISPYPVTIASVIGNPLEVTIAGLWSTSFKVATATVSEDGLSLTIARQLLLNGWDISAEVANITSDQKTISMTYKIYPTGDPNPSDQCTAVLRQ